MVDDDAASPPPRDLRGVAGIERMLSPIPFAPPDPADAPRRLADVLGVPAVAVPVVDERARWTRDGVDGVALRWEAGFGAPVEAWLLTPAGERAPLPGVLALHCHGGMKYFGKEKIADGPDGPHPQIEAFRSRCYAGRAFADDVARAGYAVLVPDAFGWGSRRIPVADMPARARCDAARRIAERRERGDEVSGPDVYDLHAALHEDMLAKTLGVLGTSWGGVIAHGDLSALEVLLGRPEVRAGTPVLAGFSGGGARAVMVSALSERPAATAAIAMMSTFRPMLDGLMHAHSWTLMNPGIGRVGDWPDIAAARAPRPLFVGYAERDPLFPLPGMRTADARIRAHYDRAGAADRYRAVWEDQPHAFGPETQRAFFGWLADLPRST